MGLEGGSLRLLCLLCATYWAAWCLDSPDNPSIGEETKAQKFCLPQVAQSRMVPGLPELILGAWTLEVLLGTLGRWGGGGRWNEGWSLQGCQGLENAPQLFELCKYPKLVLPVLAREHE